MDSYRDTAFYLAIWYAFLAALSAILLIVLNDVELPKGILIAANTTLLFALTLMALVARLNDRRLTRGQFWRTLSARPSGEHGRRMARRALEETWLRFAKNAAAVAIVLSGLAYASNSVSQTVWVGAAPAPAMAQLEPVQAPWIAYRSTRLPPMN